MTIWLGIAATAVFGVYVFVTCALDWRAYRRWDREQDRRNEVVMTRLGHGKNDLARARRRRFVDSGTWGDAA